MRIVWTTMSLALTAAIACSTKQDQPADSVAVTPATPPASAQSAPMMLVTDYGIGDLRAGMTLAEATRVADGIQLIPGADSTECSYLRWIKAPAGVLVMFDQGVVARIDIDSIGVRTEAGAQVGDSEARVDSLYAGRVTKTPHKYEDGHYLAVKPARDTNAQFRTIFETVGGKVTRYRVGRLPQVEYVEGCS